VERLTTKEAKEYLQRIENIDILIRNKSIEKAQHYALMMDRATTITANMSGERVQSSGSKHRMADTVDDKLTYIQNIEKRIAELEEEKEKIVSTIELLPTDEYDILHKCYVQHMSLKQVSVERDESYSSTTTTHGLALTKLAAILEKRATICN
jgi:DNA-directed RNA polymerase specialized sigma24 family protein